MGTSKAFAIRHHDSRLPRDEGLLGRRDRGLPVSIVTNVARLTPDSSASLSYVQPRAARNVLSRSRRASKSGDSSWAIGTFQANLSVACDTVCQAILFWLAILRKNCALGGADEEGMFEVTSQLPETVVTPIDAAVAKVRRLRELNRPRAVEVRQVTAKVGSRSEVRKYGQRSTRELVNATDGAQTAVERLEQQPNRKRRSSSKRKIPAFVLVVLLISIASLSVYNVAEGQLGHSSVSELIDVDRIADGFFAIFKVILWLGVLAGIILLYARYDRRQQRIREALQAEWIADKERMERLREALIEEHGPKLGQALWEHELAKYNLAIAQASAVKRVAKAAEAPKMIIGF